MSFNAGKGLGIVMAVSVFAIIAAFVMPVGVSEIAENTQTNVTQQENEQVELNAQLTANTTDIKSGSGGDNVTVFLNSTNNGSSTTKSVLVDNQTTKQVAIDGENINITVHNVDTSVNPDEAEMQYGVPKTYGWSGGATSLFDILDLIIILVIMLTGLGWAMKIY